ncbi:nuclear transport factor 2 family protein [uncultured Porticoccus sp.]|uniref:nuclear transport factor 2 family protein n=1 Tax=uncultured Porticoccus sp. TaxID=1256050 RepID=UPI0026261810|nr:nuclear transport factor 2 family protein [uncultured Porticoccus sp.]
MSGLTDYIRLLETLDRSNLEQLKGVLSEAVVFSDPFNQVNGADAYLALLREMFERLDSVSFTVHDSQQQDTVAYLYWTFSGNSNVTGQLEFQGSSRLTFDASGKIVRHQDFWDSADLYEKVPVLGTLFRWLRRRVAFREH